MNFFNFNGFEKKFKKKLRIYNNVERNVSVYAIM